LRGGIFFFVVGPSGSGKDSLINGARTALESERFVFARRVITRPVGAPGEDHEAATEQEFSAREARGDFLITWKAHDLRYGLPRSLKDELAAGRHIIANGSRAMVAGLAERVSRFVVIEITAPPELLAQRLRLSRLGQGRTGPRPCQHPHPRAGHRRSRPAGIRLHRSIQRGVCRSRRCRRRRGQFSSHAIA
jgi:phosphonate metabolism protein PhnN/1,5-bisphosphokinase (PRPP-forming)